MPTEALFSVARDALRETGIRGRALQDRMVEAQAHMERERGVSTRRFCAALSIPERTFWYWQAREPCAPAAVDPSEVSAVVGGPTRDQPGPQAATDQGKPYVAQEARQAYDALDPEFAPQKEGSPTAKATLERS